MKVRLVRHTVLAVLGSIAGTLLWSGCESPRCDDKVAAADCQTACCTHSYYDDHLANCSFPSECPMGTICVKPAISGATTSGQVCELPAGRSERQALIKGFQATQFPLTRSAESALASFTWKAPSNARIVHCALFSCRPDIRFEDCSGGEPRFRIQNFDICVAAHQVFEPANGLFDLGDPQLGMDLASSCSSRTTTELLVGCWAYDESRVIAATRLEPVLPNEVYDYGNFLDPDCTETDDEVGRACVLDPAERLIGRCLDGKCARPCMRVVDCELPKSVADAGSDAGADVAEASDADAAPSAPSTEWTCEIQPNEFIGACKLRETAD